MPRLGENCLNQAIWLLYLDVKRRDVTQRYNCNVSTMTWLQNRYSAFDAVSDPPKYHCQLLTTRWPDVNTDVTPLWNRFQPASGTGRRTLGATGMWKHNFMQHSNKFKNSGTYLFMVATKDIKLCDFWICGWRFGQVVIWRHHTF